MIDTNDRSAEMRIRNGLGATLLAKQIDLNSQTPRRPPEVPEFWDIYQKFLEDVYESMEERNKALQATK